MADFRKVIASGWLRNRLYPKSYGALEPAPPSKEEAELWTVPLHPSAAACCVTGRPAAFSFGIVSILDGRGAASSLYLNYALRGAPEEG